MADSGLRILLVDDKSHDRELATVMLERGLPGAEIAPAGDALEFAENLARGGFSAVVTERQLLWGDGFRVAEAVKRLYPECPVVFLCGSISQSTALDGARRGVDEFVVKESAGFLHLADIVRRVIERSTGGVPRESEGDRLLRHLPVGVFKVDGQGTFTAANPSLTELLGCECQSMPLQELFAEPTAVGMLQAALADGTPLQDLEVRVRRPDGGQFWARLNLWPAVEPGAKGDVEFEGALENISGYKEIEEELLRKTEELGRSNEELERFAYVASHDLQQPLSLISRYSKLFTERYGEQLSNDADRYIQRVMESSDRMQRMVDDILEYSRIGTKRSPFAPVDFGEAVDAASANLKNLFVETRGKYDRGELPVLNADRGQIVQLFQNLIGNALKFHGQESPEVRVAAVEEPSCWRFEVIDNGIGISSDDRDRVFGMFERLHTSEEFPGTGIGLAICKSIVQRHGGRIWVTSGPGQGSIFCFTVPK